VPGFGVRDHAVIGLWHFSHGTEKGTRYHTRLPWSCLDDTPGIENGKVGCGVEPAYKKVIRLALLSSDGWTWPGVDPTIKR